MYFAQTNNGSESRYSPLTFYQEWPMLSRLIFVVVCSILGTICNGYFIASFFVESSLRKLGVRCFVFVGVADIIMTLGVTPTISVVLLYGELETYNVCLALVFLIEVSTYTYSMFFTLVSMEIYYRVCRPKDYQVITSMHVGFVTFFVIALGVLLAGIGIFAQNDNFCWRTSFVSFCYRLCTTTIIHVTLGILTLYGLIRSALKLRKQVKKTVRSTHSTHSRKVKKDAITTYLHLIAYLMYMLAWTPYLIVIYLYPTTSDKYYYFCIWLGVGRATLTSAFYGCAHKTYRKSFVRLFKYCFCKVSLSSSDRRVRRRRRTAGHNTAREVRVHLMHHAIQSATPQRAATSSRVYQEVAPRYGRGR